MSWFWIGALGTAGCLAVIYVASLLRWRAPVPGPPPVDIRTSRLEKLGIDVRPGAATDEPGRDWSWVKEQLTAPWPRGSKSPYVRRKCWPIALFKRGTELSGGDGTTVVVPEARQQVWHIWHTWEYNQLGLAFPMGLVQGWGGQMGADLEPDDWVMVCGKREQDGTGFRPSADDIAAADWEPAFA